MSRSAASRESDCKPTRGRVSSAPPPRWYQRRNAGRRCITLDAADLIRVALDTGTDDAAWFVHRGRARRYVLDRDCTPRVGESSANWVWLAALRRHQRRFAVGRITVAGSSSNSARRSSATDGSPHVHWIQTVQLPSGPEYEPIRPSPARRSSSGLARRSR